MKECLFRPNVSKQLKRQAHPLLDTRDVTERLYTSNYLARRDEMRKQHELEKTQQELEACTFKPQLVAKKASIDKPPAGEVRGFSKTIDRLRSASKRHEERKALEERIPVGENYEKVRSQKFKPPKLLSREKYSAPETLFYIEFDLGRKKIKVNIRSGERPETLAKELAKTCSLNKAAQQEITGIIKEEVAKYLAVAKSL